MDKANNPRPQLNRDYTALKFEAAVLYIKNGLSAKEISERLNVSMSTLSKWSAAGRWSELRPDMETLTEYKAANLYINEKLTTGDIAQKLSISESRVKYWIYVNGWDAARLLNQSKNSLQFVIADFCNFFKDAFPRERYMIEIAQKDYIKTMTKN